MNKYQKNKTRIEEEARTWQLEFSEHNYSWGELAEWGDYFRKMGKRYGLLKEFKENGIC